MEKQAVSQERRSRQTRSMAGRILSYFFLTLWAVIVLFPFYWMLLTSVKSYSAYNSEYVPAFFTLQPTLQNYFDAFSAVPLGRYFLNTLIYTGVTTVIMIVVVVLSAYAFARLDFIGRKITFTLFLSLMMIPNELVVITNFVTITNLGLRNTFSGLILPSIASVFYIYLLKENFEQAIFSHAEGKTRGRMSRNAEMKEQFRFQGTRIFTSEQNILGENFTQGAFNRTIELQAADMISEELALEVHQNIKRSFGHYGQNFINYVSYHQDAVRKTYAELQERIKDYCKPRRLIESHVQHLALVYTGDTYFLKFLEDAGVIKINASLREVSDALFSPIVYLDNFDLPFWLELLPSPEESNNVIRALSAISELRFTQTKSFDAEIKDADGKVRRDPSILEPTLGIKFLNGDVAFYPDTLKQVLKDRIPTKLKSLMQDFAHRGLLKITPSKTHKNQYSLFFDGRSRWVYYFPQKTFHADL